MVLIILFGIISCNSAPSFKYIAKDCSEKYSCTYYDCDKPADGGYYDYTTHRYYCREHFLEKKASHEAYQKENANTIRCKYCDRKFDEDSNNGKNIRKTNLCLNCYNNMKSAQGALKEMPR